jgi:hypothetical protein
VSGEYEKKSRNIQVSAVFVVAEYEQETPEYKIWLSYYSKSVAFDLPFIPQI